MVGMRPSASQNGDTGHGCAKGVPHGSQRGSGSRDMQLRLPSLQTSPEGQHG